jgi:methylthioribose-1-phosphate isomerase
MAVIQFVYQLVVSSLAQEVSPVKEEITAWRQAFDVLVDKYVDAWIVRHITVLIDICNHGKMTTVFWNVTLSILSELYHHPIRTYCLHHQGR